MSKSQPLTVSQREAIYQGKLAGQSWAELAAAQGCSLSCARKWWRIGRRAGLPGLRRQGRQRPPGGASSRFDARVAERALFWKRAHPRRGATRILHDLAQDPSVAHLAQPQRSQLAACFRQVCPELLHPHAPRAVAPPVAHQVHALWQLDSKEHVVLADGRLATVLDVREPVACIWLGLFAHDTTRPRAWRKLQLAEIQADLRQVFSRYGLPQGIQTDREHVYGRLADEEFPTTFTLWLVGLGIAHHFSRPHQPRDQAQVERGHRTWTDWLSSLQPLANLTTLQTALDTARVVHAQSLPSRARECAGRAPLVAHPDVLRPLRPYVPAAEWSLFSLARVDDFLTRFVWRYTLSRSYQITIHGQHYFLGRAGDVGVGAVVEVRFDPFDRHFVISHAQTGALLKRLPAHHLDVPAITGLTEPAPSTGAPLQLSFPLG